MAAADSKTVPPVARCWVLAAYPKGWSISGYFRQISFCRRGETERREIRRGSFALHHANVNSLPFPAQMPLETDKMQKGDVLIRLHYLSGLLPPSVACGADAQPSSARGSPST